MCASRSELFKTALDLFVNVCQLLLSRLHGRPTDAKTLLFVWLRDHMEVNMIDHLMSHAAVVLQNIVLLGARGDRNLLSNREELGQVLIGNVVKLGAVVLGNHKSMTLRDGANIKKCVRLF